MPGTDTPPLTTVTASVFIEDNVIFLGDPDDPDSPIYTGDVPPSDATGLVAATDGAMQITCGVNVGQVTISVQTWEQPPPTELDDWDDVAETSVHWKTDRIQVIGAAVDDAPVVPIDLPATEQHTYRVRDHARNRDAGEDRTDTDPTEHHLLQIWAAPPAPDQLLKATDTTGQTWRI
jgi:hypothetical protein